MSKTIYNESDHSKNSFMNLSENHFELSLTKVNMAIQKLKTQPSKSILKKVSDSTLMYTSQADLDNTHLRDSSFQVNLNTLINAGLVECSQAVGANATLPTPLSVKKSSRKKGKLMRKHDSSSSCSSLECANENAGVKRYSISISSSLSKYNESHHEDTPVVTVPSVETSYELDEDDDIHNTTQNHMSYAMKKELSLLTVSSNSSSRRSISVNNLTGGSSSSSLSLSEKTLNDKLDSSQHCLNENLKVQDYLNELQHLSKQNSFAASKKFTELNQSTLEQTARKLPTSDHNILHLNAANSMEQNGLMHTNSSETSSGYLSFSAMNVITNVNVAANKKGSKATDSRRSLSPNPLLLNAAEKRFSYALATASSNNLNGDTANCE